MKRILFLLAVVAVMVLLLFLLAVVAVMVLPAQVNVHNFGATPGDSSDDTAAFEQAMAAAGAGEVVLVPGPGAYRIFSVDPPSDTTVHVDSDAVLKKFGTTNGPLFNLQGATDTNYLQNVHFLGINGKFTMELADAGTATVGMRLRNVEHFSIRNVDCIQNNSNQSGEAPSSRKPCFSYLPTPDGAAARDGVLENAHGFNSPFGWGLTQVTGGTNLRFFDISSEGGVPLRLENFQNNWTPMDDIVADGVVCKNGHDAVHLNPHAATHGTFTVTNVVADSCESAISIKNDAQAPGSHAPDSSITGVDVIPGDQAQLRADSLGAWTIGPSRYCLDNHPEDVGYTIQINDLNCGGLPHRNP